MRTSPVERSVTESKIVKAPLTESAPRPILGPPQFADGSVCVSNARGGAGAP